MATNVKTPLFMIGLDKNSIVVPISSYALGENSPLSSIGQMRLTNGTYASINQFNAADVKNGLYFGDTHFRPNSAYRLRNRVPFTFFAPLQSEMGDAWATGANNYGQLGMGYQYSDVGYTRLYGNWDKVVISETHAAALSTCGTKKKLFVCGGNAYGQLGLTNVAISQPALTETQTVWKQLQNIWTWVWDDSGETYYYRNILDSEDILDVEVGDDFTLIKTDVQLYGCGRMSNMGIAAPGANYGSDYQFQDVRGNSFDSFYVPYFTSFLQRSAPIFFYYNNGADFTSYTNIPSNSVKKFQARGARWFHLNTSGRLYGQGKLGPSGTSYSNSPITMPVGATDQRVSLIYNVPGYVSTTQLYGPGNPNTRYNEQFYGDFESNKYCIAALSANFKTWLVHGPTSFTFSGTSAQTAGNPSLSTICLFDPNQNAYVPQNDYFLRLYPSFLGFMANYNGKLYFTPNGAFMNQGLDAGGVNGAGTGIISRLPASTLPVLSNALGANPAEKANLRKLVPLTYMGQPDISWKSLFTTDFYSAAIDVNNKLYVTGYNSLTSSGINAKSLLGFPSATNNIYTFTKVNEENIYNTNSNYANLVVYKTDRNPAPSPVPIPSPTPTPSVTPVLPFYNTGEIMYTKRTGSGGFNREDGMTENYSVWYNNIQYSNDLACDTQVAGVYPYKMMRLELEPYIAPQAQYGKYDHYSYAMLYLKPQIEPQSFGSRKCFVFSASPSVGGVLGGYKDLCFHYFSQAYRPDLPICNGPLSTVSKMAPNSGTFGDGRSSRQRIEIKTNVGESCLVDFYIKPEDNSYHVIFTAKTDPATYDSQTRNVYPYYTKSTNRGASWSTPLLIGNNYYNPRSHDWYPCNTGGYNPNTVDPAITNKKGNADKPAVLFMEQNGGEYNPYNVVCKYTYNTPFDSSVTLASGYVFGNQNLPPWYNDAPRLNFDAQFAHFKILYDNANRLITLWTGTAGPTMTQQRTNYVGQGRSRVVYRYLTDENSNTWSPLVTACRTFPHSNIAAGGNRPYVDVGRYWDACIDDSDNNLCILYTPDPSNSGGYSFSAFVAKVIKINITTGATIYDETVLDITSLPMGVDYYPKSIGSVNLYYDSQLNKLVAQCFTMNIQGNEGKLYRMQRNSTNNWSEIPYLGASGILPRAGSQADNWVTIQRNVRT
jgi:hypothetical protein